MFLHCELIRWTQSLTAVDILYSQLACVNIPTGRPISVEQHLSPNSQYQIFVWCLVESGTVYLITSHLIWWTNHQLLTRRWKRIASRFLVIIAEFLLNVSTRTHSYIKKQYQIIMRHEKWLAFPTAWQTQDVDPMSIWCWYSVVDAAPPPLPSGFQNKKYLYFGRNMIENATS